MTTIATECLDDVEILAFLQHAQDAPERARIVAHMEECDSCRKLVADLVRAAETDREAEGMDGEQRAPARYVLLSTLGAGAMGVVHAAFDRQLDRKVALKFLSATPGEDAARAQARLQREAQALAKLAHPNVVTVHDVGTLDDEVYVAMELVQGSTLRDWLAAKPRAVGAVLAIMQQAGEGLAAAHAAGLVHRDFKPDNVLVGDDGRVRVTDFGLARSSSEEDDEPTSDVAATQRPLATLTRSGVRAGTPAYMAPEQKAGEPPSPRSDVYSFSVTLHEAITGTRPGGTLERSAPAWLERAMARGCSARVEDRWPTMRAFLDALARGPRVTRGRVAMAAVSLVAVSVAVLGVHERATLPSAPPPCPVPLHAFDGVWDEARRASLVTALRASGHEATLAHVLPELDAYRAAWADREVETCAATRVRGEQSERLLDLRMACLDDRRRSLDRTVSLLTTVDPVVASHGVEMVAGIPDVETCAKVRSLQESVPLPPGSKEGIARAKVALDDARALFYAGKPADARAHLEPTIAEVTRLGDAPLLGQLLFWRGRIEHDLALDDECEVSLSAAAVQALEGYDDRTLAQVWTLLGSEVRARGRPERARAWVDQAGAAIRRLGGDDELEGERELSLGTILRDPAEAKAALLRARELLVKTRGTDYYLVATVDQQLGNLCLATSRPDEAMRYHASALELRRRLFGEDHASTVSSTFNVAEDAITLKHPAEARAALRELGTRVASHVAEERAWFALKMGDIARLEGNFAEALVQHRVATTVKDAHSGPEDPVRSGAWLAVGQDLNDLGRYAEAIPPLEMAEKLALVTGEADAADSWLELGIATFAAGDAARGRALVMRAEAEYEKAPAATDPTMHAKATTWLAAHR